MASELPTKVAEYVLYSEFDIDKGSTLRGSYPDLPSSYSREFFADAMLPEGVHNRDQDFTIFFLNRDKAFNNLLSASPGDSKIAEGDKRFMYCLNVVLTCHDPSVRRGATVRAVAICSPSKHCLALKNVLYDAVTRIATTMTEEEAASVLSELYSMVNSLDVQAADALSQTERRLAKCKICMDNGNLSALDQDATRDSMYLHTSLKWGDEDLRIVLNRCSSDDQYDDARISDLLEIFGEQSMVIYNAIVTGQRLLFLGHECSAGELCNYVLATSHLVCPPMFGLIRRQYPYANLTHLAFLETPGYIAGVTNPMFASKHDWWDVLCDLSTGEIMTTPGDKEQYESCDRQFILEVLDGLQTGQSEDWVRCMFEEYTRENVTDLAMNDENPALLEANAEKMAVNNVRITQWARTENYKLYAAYQEQQKPFSKAFQIQDTGVDLLKHIRSLQADDVRLDNEYVEQVYADFVTLLHTEDELQEFLSYLPLLRGGLHVVAQGIFHPWNSVKYNTVELLKRLEEYPATAPSLNLLNVFTKISYQRVRNAMEEEKKVLVQGQSESNEEEKSKV